MLRIIAEGTPCPAVPMAAIIKRASRFVPTKQFKYTYGFQDSLISKRAKDLARARIVRLL